MSAWGMIRLGASVQENALATLTDLLGDPTGAEKKPARADIQKYKDVYDLWLKKQWGDDEQERSQISPGAEAAQKWDDEYALNPTEKVIISEYQKSYQVHDEDKQKAFESTIRKLRADSMYGLQSLNDNELKKLVGGALKKYEKQNYPLLYSAIKQGLDDAYRRGPYESYKMWPRMVQWIKDRFEWWLWYAGNPNQRNQYPADLEDVPHYVDLATEGGAILSQLRAENKLPQNFDANQLTAPEFESWLMDWKQANRESEAQGEVVYEFKDGSTIQKLTTPESLQFEGDEMGHCVGSYSHRVESGDTIIYSLRDKSGEPHVTMEIEGMEAYRRADQVSELSGYDDPAEGARENGVSVYEPPHDPTPHVMDMINPTEHEPGEHTQQISNADPTEENKYGWGKTGEKAFQVVQIQGKSNNTPKPEYQAKIREFLDYLRSKGWKFERSDAWYGNYDDPYTDDNDEYEDSIEEARDLDEWYDNHYKTNLNRYRYEEERHDAYGMPLPAFRMRPGVSDFTELIQSCLGSLIEEYDQGRWRGRWYELAQQVYHAWIADISVDDPDEQRLAKEKKDILSEIETAEDTLREWEWQNEGYALQDSHIKGEIVEKVKEHLEKDGRWPEIEAELAKEHGPLEDPEFDEYDLDDVYNVLQEEQPDLIGDIQHEEVNKWYSEDANKFCNYLYMLVMKNGMVGPNDLPDPNERHGGLPSYEELEKMPWLPDGPQQTGLDIPGTLSSWHEAIVDIGLCQCGGSIGADGYCMQCGRFNDEYWRPQRVPRGMPGQTQALPAAPPTTGDWSEVIPGTFSRRFAGFYLVAADVTELAQKAIANLQARDDLRSMNAPYLNSDGSPNMGGVILDDSGHVVPADKAAEYGLQTNPKYNPTLYQFIFRLLGQLPPEVFKFYGWVVKQIKNQAAVGSGEYPWGNTNHLRDILTQAFQHMEYLRSQPPNSPNAAPVPDINQLDFPALEKWVYDRNAMGIDVRPGTQWDYDTGQHAPLTPGDEFPHAPQAKKWDVGDGWVVSPVWSENDLKQEGNLMGHCVGGYCQGVHNGSTAIFSLRDPKGEPHATIELEPNEGIGGYNVVQVQGKQNQEPATEYQAKVRQFFDQLKTEGYELVQKVTAFDINDLENYEYLSAPSEIYGVAIDADVDEYAIARDLVQEAESGSSNSYALEGLDKLIGAGLIDEREMSENIRGEADYAIEQKQRELASDWQDRKDRLKEEWESEQDEDEDEDEDSRDSYPDFDEWLEINYPDEYQAEQYGFEEQAEDELPEVAELRFRYGSVTWGSIA